MSSSEEFVDIWTLATQEKKMKESEKIGPAADDSGGSRREESHIFLVGSQSGGKTSLILRLLDRNETPKPTHALEYTYARKSRGTNLVKEVCHIWEQGGGASLSQLMDVPLSQQSINCISLMIVLDLSKPDQLWDTAETIINQVRKRTSEILSELKTTSPKLLKSLKLKAHHRYGDDHPDKDLVNPLLIPTAIIGNKYDLFQEFDPEKKKIISKSLRFLAHTIGASLMFCSIKSDAQLNRAQQLMSHFAFDTPISQSVSMDHNKPLIVPVGSDALGQIGAPTVSSGGELDTLSAKSPFDLWRQSYKGFFPCSTVQQDKSHDSLVGVADDPCKDKKYLEHVIDTLRTQKDEELQRYIRDCERKEKQREARLKTTPTS